MKITYETIIAANRLAIKSIKTEREYKMAKKAVAKKATKKTVTKKKK